MRKLTFLLATVTACIGIVSLVLAISAFPNGAEAADLTIPRQPGSLPKAMHGRTGTTKAKRGPIGKSSQTYVEMGMAFFQRGQFAQAIDMYSEAIRLDPNNSEAYYKRGLARSALAALHDWPEAQRDFKKASDLLPQDAPSRSAIVAARKTTDLEARISFWKGRVFRCNHQFPSKTDDYARDAVNCDDGDMTLFNGMLCAQGEKEGCQAVKNSQDGDGRYWRSPRLKLVGDLKPREQPEINSDQNVGVMAYVLQENDPRSFRDWLGWIKRNGPPPRFCPLSLKEDALKYCIFKAVDCPMIVLLGFLLREQSAAFSVCVPPQMLGLPNPETLRPKLQDAVKAYRGAVAAYEDVWNKVIDLHKKFHVPPPPRDILPPLPQVGQDFEPLLAELDERIRKFTETLTEPGGVALAYTAAVATANFDALTNGVGSTDDDAASARHLAGAVIYLLKKLKIPGTIPLEGPANLLRQEPNNPFFEYLTYGSSDRMLDLILDQCPDLGFDPLQTSHNRSQWSWERQDSKKKGQDTMYWDCLFIASLYKDGLISVKTSVPGELDLQLPNLKDPWENVQDSEKSIEGTIKIINDLAGQIDGLRRNMEKILEALAKAGFEAFKRQTFPTRNPDGTYTVPISPGVPGGPTVNYDPKGRKGTDTGVRAGGHRVCVGWC